MENGLDAHHHKELFRKARERVFRIVVSTGVSTKIQIEEKEARWNSKERQRRLNEDKAEPLALLADIV